MAAADYYTSHPPTSGHHASPAHFAPPSADPGPYLLPPTSQPQYGYPPTQQPASTPQPPHHFAPAPPPYQPLNAEKPHSLRPPTAPYQRNSFSHPQRPNFQQWDQPYTPTPPPPGHGPGRPQMQPYNPQSYSGPYLHPDPSGVVGGGYVSDPEPHRRRRHSRNKKSSSSGHSSKTDGFIGAAGGGLIGDLIFPGLGTVGGALAGWLGGKEYGEHRKRRDSNLEREQQAWEQKFGSSHRRSGSGSSDRQRKRSHD